MNQATCYSGHEKTVINLELNGMLQFLALFCKHAIQSFRLSYRPWEAVQYESAEYALAWFA